MPRRFHERGMLSAAVTCDDSWTSSRYEAGSIQDKTARRQPRDGIEQRAGSGRHHALERRDPDVLPPPVRDDGASIASQSSSTPESSSLQMSAL